MSGPQKIPPLARPRVGPAGAPEPDSTSRAPEVVQRQAREAAPGTDEDRISDTPRPPLLTGRRGLDAGLRRLEEFLQPFSSKLDGE